MAHRRRVNAKGRNPNWKGVALDEYLLSSAAYRALSGDARALYVEFRRRFAPSRNGSVPFSIREIAISINRTEKTASKVLKELTDKGFVRCRFKGTFSMKIRLASEWELTEYQVGEKPAAKDFINWRPEKKNLRQ